MFNPRVFYPLTFQLKFMLFRSDADFELKLSRVFSLGSFSWSRLSYLSLSSVLAASFKSSVLSSPIIFFRLVSFSLVSASFQFLLVCSFQLFCCVSACALLMNLLLSPILFSWLSFDCVSINSCLASEAYSNMVVSLSLLDRLSFHIFLFGMSSYVLIHVYIYQTSFYLRSCPQFRFLHIYN